MARSHGVAVRRSEPHAHPLLHFLSHPRRIGRMAPVAQLPELLVRHRRRVRPAVVTRRTWRMPRPRPLNRRSRPGRRQSPRYRGVSGRTRAARRRRRARSSTPRPSQGRVAAPRPGYSPQRACSKPQPPRPAQHLTGIGDAWRRQGCSLLRRPSARHMTARRTRQARRREGHVS